MKPIALDTYFGQKSFIKSIEIGLLFTKKIFTPKDIDVSYTNINYWDKMGVLSSFRKGKKAWRNFNFIDYVWIKIINELRELGVPTWLIKEAKKNCFQGIDLNYEKIFELVKDKQVELKDFNEPLRKKALKSIQKFSLRKAQKIGFNYLLLAVWISISEKTPVSLFLFKNGECMFWIENRRKIIPKEVMEKISFESYINISLSKIIKDFLMEERSVFLLSELPLLNSAEIRLMELIHSGNYESITIYFKDKKMNLLELDKRQDTKRKILDIVAEAEYQEILIKTHGGMITSIKSAEKEYLSNHAKD